MDRFSEKLPPFEHKRGEAWLYATEFINAENETIERVAEELHISVQELKNRTKHFQVPEAEDIKTYDQLLIYQIQNSKRMNFLLESSSE